MTKKQGYFSVLGAGLRSLLICLGGHSDSALIFILCTSQTRKAIRQDFTN